MMIISCKTCHTRFNLDDNAVKPTGSKVRCSVCDAVFTVYPEEEIAPSPSEAHTPPVVVEIHQRTAPAVKPPVPPEPEDTRPGSERSSRFGRADAMADTGKTKAPVAPEEIDLAEFEGEIEAVDINAVDEAPEEPEFKVVGISRRSPTSFVDGAREEPELRLDLSGGPASMASMMSGNSRFVMAGGGMEKIEYADAPKEKTRWGLILVVMLLILMGVGSVFFYFMLQKNITLSTLLGRIPVIGHYVNPQTPDPGFRKLSTRDVTDRYMENSTVGQLFVVSGKVESGYTENRGRVSLLGELFSDGKMIQEQMVFAGNLMSDLELSSMGWDEIKKRMEESRNDVKLEPGQTLPFMIVFSNFPSQPDKVTIELKGSEPFAEP